MNITIQTPTPDMAKSVDFYDALGFTKIKEDGSIFYTDGKALIEINPTRTARTSVKLYNDSWAKVVAALSGITKVIDSDNGYLLSDVSGVWIYLIEGRAPEIPTEATPSKLGNFAGISIESIDMAGSIALFEKLGLTLKMGGPDQGWCSLGTDEGQSISVMAANMCPHLFFNPSLTYFNGENNIQVINDVRNAKVAIAEEITHFNKEGKVDNIVLEDPGGLGMFCFND